MGFHHDLGGLCGKGEYGGHAAGAAPCITLSLCCGAAPAFSSSPATVCGSNVLAMPNAAVLCNLPGLQLLQQAFLKNTSSPLPPFFLSFPQSNVSDPTPSTLFSYIPLSPWDC